jgi:beta-lactamase class A
MTHANIGGRSAMPAAMLALAVVTFTAVPLANEPVPIAPASQQTPALSPPSAELKGKLERRLQEIAGRLNGVAGYVILDLASGDRIAHLDRAVFPTASTIKLAIVYELFKQAQDAKIHLDERITLDRAKAVGGSGVLFEMGTPTLSISDYATLMVTLSDNTATNVLIDRLGMADITRRMQTLGLGETRLRRHMMDTAAAKRGDENVSTPNELAELLRLMNGPLATGGAAAKPNPMADAIELLKKPKESRLRKGLPEGVATADKPGELDGVRVDAGIVYVTNRPYIFCVMTTFLKDEGEGEKAIEEMSRVTYEYFSRLGAGATLGRRLDP